MTQSQNVAGSGLPLGEFCGVGVFPEGSPEPATSEVPEESTEANPVEAPEEIPAPREQAAADMAAQSLELLGAWTPETNVTWNQLWNTYPKYQPFVPKDPWEVLRVSIQDIGRLPREYWHLGSNEFLVSGYCTYRHLLLIRDGQEELYYLGVPGDSMAQDRHVAETFGFRQYRPADQIGYKLERQLASDCRIVGTLSRPVHAVNLEETVEEIQRRYPEHVIVAIDASIGRPEQVGTISLGRGGIRPGLGVRKRLARGGGYFYHRRGEKRPLPGTHDAPEHPPGHGDGAGGRNLLRHKICRKFLGIPGQELLNFSPVLCYDTPEDSAGHLRPAAFPEFQ